MDHSPRRLNALSKAIGAKRYLEIGVAAGDTFRDVDVPEKTGVDPAFAFDTTTLTNDVTRLISAKSDDFFATDPIFPPYDLVFIDGLHTFEQTLRDFHNALIRCHRRSVILIDDTMPSDVFSALPDEAATNRFRQATGSEDSSWHGDVYKLIFYLHDFWPSLNYRTILGSGNPQTLVWRINGSDRAPHYNNLEKISRLTYFDLIDHIHCMQAASETETIELCISDVNSL